jgi:hypothetical protein
MCDVPSTAVFCSETIECFPGIASKLFLKLLVTIPVAPIITGIIVLIIIIIIIIMDISCHRSFLPGTSLEPAVNPTAQASSFTLLHTAVLSVLCVMFQV